MIIIKIEQKTTKETNKIVSYLNSLTIILHGLGKTDHAHTKLHCYI